MLIKHNIRIPRQPFSGIHHGPGESQYLAMVERTRGAGGDEGRNANIGILFINDVGDDGG